MPTPEEDILHTLCNRLCKIQRELQVIMADVEQISTDIQAYRIKQQINEEEDLCDG